MQHISKKRHPIHSFKCNWPFVQDSWDTLYCQPYKPTNANVKSRSPSCASASTKNTIFFPCTGIFLSVYELKKFNCKVEKIFSSILSKLKCWMQPIKKQNKRCQKSKWKIKISMYSRYFNVCIPAIENWFQYKQKWHKVISVIIIKCFFICH